MCVYVYLIKGRGMRGETLVLPPTLLRGPPPLLNPPKHFVTAMAPWVTKRH